MKKIKNILEIIWNIYGYLSCIIHEISHIFVIILLGATISKIDVRIRKKHNLCLECFITTNTTLNKVEVFLIAFSPFIIFILIGVLAFFYNFFFYLFIYEISNFVPGRTLPSEADVYAFQKMFIKFRTEEEIFDTSEFDEITESNKPLENSIYNDTK